ncbi:MAG: VPLPA-CTERM sorting domain-containing protein [Pseudomonadota bacterium]
MNGTTGSSPFAAASVAAVPLPATGWMLLAGISGVAAMSRRKKRK